MGEMKARWYVLDQKQKAAFFLTQANNLRHQTSANDTISPKISMGKKKTLLPVEGARLSCIAPST